VARKPAVLLKSTEVKPSKRHLAFVKSEEGRDPAPGCETEWQRYLTACREQGEADARLDAISRLVEKDGGTSASSYWTAFEEALRASQRASSAVIGSLNAYLYRAEHINDDKLVPEEELRVIVADSLSDKLEGLAFSMNHGILGSKVAQAIRTLVIESEAVEPPLCPDCN
jgi:hypothetical protein